VATAAQIAGYAHSAGWTGSDLVVAVAVALAESSGNPSALGDVGAENAEWGPSVGLWQIRSLNAEKGKGTLRDEIANRDPQTNANHAYSIWKTQGWGPWSAHNNKSYLLYMPIASAGASDYYTVNPGQAAGDAVDAVTPDSIQNAAAAALEIAKEPVRVLKWLEDPYTQVRIGKVIIGGGLVVVGLYIFARPVVQPAINAGAKIGKVAAL
jgi:hypothetical protein